jgi:hypothetical protein
MSKLKVSVSSPTSRGRDFLHEFAIIYGDFKYPKMGVPQNGWFLMQNPIKINFLGTPILGNLHILL